MSEHSEDAPPHEDSAEPTSPPPELSPSLGELDVELGIVEDSYNDTPEEPPTDTFPSYAQDDSPPPFAFPTAEEVAAQQRRSVEMVVADDADGFESVALGEREEQQEEEDLDEFSSIVLEEEEEEDTTPVATEAEEAEEGARSEHSSSTEPTATPSLSQSLSTTPPTTAPSSKVALPTSSETVSVAAAEEPQTPTVASKDVSKHVQAPSKGASVMQKVVSMTRQRDLPPKAKEEEHKHLRELEEMRKASKEAEKRRKSEAEAALHARAAVLAAALPTWEASILPNWRVVLRPDANGRALRRLWWDGTMPVWWRGRLWGMCIGNGLAVSRSAYGVHLARARKGREEGRYPAGEMEMLLRDVEETMTELKMFQEGGVMHEDLVELLMAYSVYSDGVPRYPPGISFPAAMLLVNMSPAEAFSSLLNLVTKSCLKSFYSHDTEEIDAYHRIFDTLLADTMPAVYANFSKQVVRPSLYLNRWLTTAFVRYLPLDLSTRLFDVFLLEGDSFLFRIALVLLQILEPRLFNPVLSELDAVFKGEDRGAVLLVRREKGREEVSIEEVYTEMGCGEEEVVRRLERLEWKEETWDRLVTRELPEAD